jgi:hypothetical protein
MKTKGSLAKAIGRVTGKFESFCAVEKLVARLTHE